VERALDSARVIGTRVSVEPPSYVGVRVDARVRAQPDADVERVERDAITALFRYFNPLSGGPEARGWPLGRPVQSGEVYSVLSRVPGVDYVDRVVLFRADPRDGSVGEPTDRIDLASTHLVISVEHLVEAST
jgi:phage-related baseplate assembly protein